MGGIKVGKGLTLGGDLKDGVNINLTYTFPKKNTSKVNQSKDNSFGKPVTDWRVKGLFSDVKIPKYVKTPLKKPKEMK